MTTKNYAVVTEVDGEQEIRFCDTQEKGAVPVEYDRPAYDEKTQVLSLSRFDVGADRVIARYRAEQKPRRTDDRRFSFDDLVEAIAGAVATKMQGNDTELRE